MQHNMMRQPATPFGAEPPGDVLASIRRLIAQDEAGCRLQTVAEDAAAKPQDMPESPLVLDSSDMIAAAGDAATTAEKPAQCATSRDASPWLQFDSTQSPSSAPDATNSLLAGSSESLAKMLFAAVEGEETTDSTTSGPSNKAPSTTTVQMEETMLHANASVTPINAAGENAARENADMHLFAPEDKGAQKGNHLRGMIREAIRQELQGEIGNRLSRNLQAMIRQEIEVTLRQMCEEE